MNKDKEIEEIAQAQGKFCKDNGRSCGDCPVRSGKGGLAGKCQYYAIAERLYDNGIRVAREVRKETAKEILWNLKQVITDGLLKNHEILNAYMKYYGVEVQE